MVRGAHPRDENGNYTCPGRVPVETLIAEWENREYKVHPNEQETFDKVKRIEEQKKRHESTVKPLEAIGNEKAILQSPLLTQDKNLLNDIALGRGRAILKGDSSFEIIKIQEALNNFGFDIRPSGVFCEETENLFNEFRESHIPTNSVHSSYVLVDKCIIDSNAILRIDEALIESWKVTVLKSDLFKNSEGLNKLAKNKTPAIKLKSKNKDDIAIIQEALIKFGFEFGKSGADGFFGEKTELAVMSFQANFNPTHEVHDNYQKHLADGVVNADAILAMDEASVIGWKYVNNIYGISIDHVFISQLEGVELNGYVPMPESSNSGVTIAVGFDLGARNEADLIALQFPSTLIDRFKPYLGLKKFKADEFVKKNPLSINNDELKFITKQVKESETKKIIAAYNKYSSVKFGSLPPQAQTVVASVAYQYGSQGVIDDTPNFWNQAINQDWEGMYNNLMDFKDETPSRRRKEANLIKELM